MDKRRFLQLSSYLSIGGMIFPQAFLSSCSKETLLPDLTYDGEVLIIGAGAAGLYAGYLLQARGIKFKILEADSRYGGRLGKIENFADYPLDAGAQWLHGANNIVSDLAIKSVVKVTLDEGSEKFWFQNELVDELPLSTAIFEGDDLPDISFKDYALQRGLDEDYANIIEQIAGDQGAAADQLSVYHNNREEENWNSGEEDFKFPATFFDLIDQKIVDPIREHIFLNTPVTTINYSDDIITVSDDQGNAYFANKVILTVPITILQAGDIDFVPPLPTAKTEAFNRIGMGPGMKVFLKFSNRFFDENIIGGPICAAYADESVGKNGNDHVLLAFVMGDQAAALSALDDDQLITTALLAELDEMYQGQASSSFLDSYVEDWSRRPFIRGAYSYSTIGIGDARTIAAQPLADKLFFAGEAMNITGHHQTVHGAVESGYREVINLLNTVG
jgi:lysine-specific histone demethylase 1B